MRTVSESRHREIRLAGHHHLPQAPRAARDQTLRIELTDHVVELGDGHRVGVSVGGQGVPFVFMHGLTLSRRHYLQMLSHVADQGYRVVAIDSAGHGDTHDLRWAASGFAHRVDLTLRTLDALGIERAVFAGHSIGGRLAMEVAAAAPDRVLATVLLNAAAGTSFDQKVGALMHAPHVLLRRMVGFVANNRGNLLRTGLAAAGRYCGLVVMLSWVAMGRAACGLTCLAGWMRALLKSLDTPRLLHAIGNHGIPTVIVHGEKDRLVPIESAREVADNIGATLYRVPRAGHSWMIANPCRTAHVMREIINGALADVIRQAAHSMGIAEWRNSAEWDRALIAPRAQIRELAPTRITDNQIAHLTAGDRQPAWAMSAMAA